MFQVRLTATNPQDSSIVPVACNDKGELLLEEPIQGPPGQDGADGEDGKDGEDGEDGKDGKDGDPLDLPPDPYEGALLGWLNNELAWVGTPPVPIPEGVFGPILSWNPDSSYLEIEGDVPEDVRNGVYVYQCDERGDYFTYGWKTNQIWSSIGASYTSGSPELAKAFNGDLSDSADTSATSGEDNQTITANLGLPLNNETVEVFAGHTRSGLYVTIDGVKQTTLYVTGSDKSKVFGPFTGTLTSVSVTNGQDISGRPAGLAGVKVGNALLVDTNESLNLRVNQRYGNGLIGVPNVDIGFTPGKYLFVPSQRVAPWVLYEGDPTSVIDALRQNRD